MGGRLGQIGAAGLIWAGIFVFVSISSIGASTVSTAALTGLDSAAANTPVVGVTTEGLSEEREVVGAATTVGFPWMIAGVGALAVVLVVVVVVVKSRRGRKIGLEAYLVIKSGSRAGLHYRIEKARTRIGSQADNDLVVTDDHISRHHLCLTYERGVFVAVDLNSLYGTYIDGKRIERAQAAAGDKINLGGSVDLELFIRQ